MKKIFILLFTILCCNNVFCQTVTFKPGPKVGQDAIISKTDNSQDQNMNFGNEINIISATWTWDGTPGTIRSLLRFDELSTIPPTAIIVSAELKLYGVTFSNIFPGGNSSYPGSGLSSNKSIIQRVTKAWNEQTVTWNTQPTTTTVDQIIIPQSTSIWNYHFTDNSANLTRMIQDMVTNPASNFGFMIKLETEAHWRSLVFASSDHSNPLLWPELTVTYIDCQANFSYTVNTTNPNSYFFMASNPAVDHYWTINGGYASNAASFTHILPTGNHTICYVRYLESTKCQKCITLCVDKAAKSTDTEEFQEIETQAVEQGKLLEGDVISADAHKIKVYPNPTTNGWTVNIFSDREEMVRVLLADSNGKVVYSENKALTSGDNSFVINSNNVVPGSYIVKITGNTIQFSDKLLKK